MSEITSTKELKRVLGKKDLLSIAVGQTIGSGIFALLGVGIGMTGKSANISMIIAAIFVLLMTVPMILVSGTVRLRGGFYTQLGFLMNKTVAGFYVIVHIISWMALAMYALSAADYMIALLVGVNLNKTLLAFLVLTIFYVTNLFGIQGTAKLQNIMMLCMCVGLTVFICYGLPKVQPGYFVGPDFITDGWHGLFAAGALFTWAVGGANVIIHLGAEAKNPTKDIPFIIVVATLIIATFYGLIATVASGVLPISEVAFKPLSVVASEIFPRPVYVFFIVGGAIFALTTTLNASFGWVTKPILQAAVDGWFPPIVAKIGKKYKAPVTILTLLYLECLIPIFFGVNVSAIADMAVILTNVCFALVCFSTINMRKKIPEIWAKSRFNMSDKMVIFWSVVGGLSTIAQNFLLIGIIGWKEVIGNVVLLVLALLYAFLREKSGKVNMEISYEET
ncbi:APC family permease [Treponema primitia]|uniref:APC family permease n=1 Tax=Treponema primitia TaxID=88058 RepID=UPI00398014C9